MQMHPLFLCLNSNLTNLGTTPTESNIYLYSAIEVRFLWNQFK